MASQRNDRAEGAWDTRQLVTMALLAAIAVLLMFLQIPILPGVSWLTYDPAGAVSMIAGLAFGPGAGVTVGAAAAIVHGVLVGDFAGALMNILAMVGFVLPAATVYRRFPTMGSAAVGLVGSAVAATFLAVLGNLVVTPLYLGVPVGAVVGMILPFLVPFNLIKTVLNGALTLVLFPAVRRFLVAGEAPAPAPGAPRPASRPASRSEAAGGDRDR